MTRFLRTSCWAAGDMPPITTVVSEDDTKDTLEAARFQVEVPDTFAIHDIFELDGGIVEATAHSVVTIDGEYEQNMAVLYFYAINMLTLLKPYGLWQTPDPSPLRVEDITYVFKRVIERDEYKGQTLRTHSPEGVSVSVVNGHIKVGDGPKAA